MDIKTLENKLNLKCLNPDVINDQEVSGVFISDLLSWVIGNGLERQAWITIQGHLNVIAVAVLKEFSCIIVAHNAVVDEDAVSRATEESLPIFTTDLTVYEIAKKCVEIGL